MSPSVDRSLAARSSGEHGAATELVIATPLLLLLVLLVVQFAMWQHAIHIADAAAQEGARAARLQGGTALDGATRARVFLAQLSPTILVHPDVVARRNADTARVEITGQALMVVPGLHLSVRAVSQGPVEVFRPAALGFVNSEATLGANAGAVGSGG
jgi:Flp pilus assembly protein TadG